MEKTIEGYRVEAVIEETQRMRRIYGQNETEAFVKGELDEAYKWKEVCEKLDDVLSLMHRVFGKKAEGNKGA